jgi:hypothetical protein
MSDIGVETAYSGDCDGETAGYAAGIAEGEALALSDRKRRALGHAYTWMSLFKVWRSAVAPQ